MAAALLARHLAARGVDVRIASAGWLEADQPAPPEVARALAEHGIDRFEHRSARVDDAALRRADLVVAMGREHLRAAVAVDPDVWTRAFTLKQLARVARDRPRRTGETLTDWAERLGTGRSPTTMTGASAADDVADPFGRRLRHYRTTARELDELTAALAEAGWPAA